jgi:predicted nuclease of predicted toxin-antitoxin system
VKIIVDAQLPPGLTTLLAQIGHDAQHVVALGLRDASDRAVWDRAVQLDAAILTKDEDFAARRLRETQGPTIIWLRVGNCSRAALARWLLPLFSSIEQLAADGEKLIEVR